MTDGSNAHSLISWVVLKVSPPQYIQHFKLSLLVYCGHLQYHFVLYYWLDPFILVCWVLHLLMNVLMEPRLYEEFSIHREMVYSAVSTMYVVRLLDYV